MTNPTPPATCVAPSTSPRSCSARRQRAAAGRRAPSAATAIVFETDDATFGSTLELSPHRPGRRACCGRPGASSRPRSSRPLERLVRARDGRLVLAAADADRSPQLVQAFQAQCDPDGRRRASPASRSRSSPACSPTT